MSSHRTTPILVLPFVLLWDLITWILCLTGRVLAAVVGLVLMIAGIFISMTIIGAFVGVPLIIFGFLLMLRSIF